MDIDSLVRELGRQMGLPLALDARRACRLVVEDRHAVDIEAGDDRVFLYAEIGALPARGRGALYQTMLEANLFGRDTHGATLAIDLRRGTAFVQRILPLAGLELATLVAELENLIRAAMAWTTRVAEAAPVPAAAPADESAMMFKA